MDSISILDFYRSSPDWVKAVWVLSIPFFAVAMTGIVLRYRVEMRRLSAGERSAAAADR
ncbi:hypothetical protein [Gellertiella hungarica]|uniref:Heme exporter protein D n=1 Tax=Gellertiella hungarica TaxID=1572859 RepID=A0A7W6J6P9_9HYPH|nr:hypothetical protein [Gellertiella hungarica]MBB4064997.1 hypothetical protein [Gellertiella hungarica]